MISRFILAVAVAAALPTFASASAAQPKKSGMTVGASVVSPCSVSVGRRMVDDQRDGPAVSCADHRKTSVRTSSDSDADTRQANVTEAADEQVQNREPMRVIEVIF